MISADDPRIKLLNSPMSQGLMKAFAALVDEISKDRVQYFAAFVTTWRRSCELIDWYAERLLDRSMFAHDKELMDRLYDPYDCFSLMASARLMDHLEEAEELCFKEEVVKVDAAWQKFVAAIPVRFPKETALAKSIEANHAEVQRIVLGMYFGDLPAVLRPDWGRSLKGLKADMARLFQLCDEQCAEKGVTK